MQIPFQYESLPAGIQDDIGYALYAPQLGERSIKAKPLHGLGSQVMRLSQMTLVGPTARSYGLGWRIDLRDPCLQKKSKDGIATPKGEIEMIRQRLKQLRNEVRNAKKRGA